ncbi:MAG: hypothetical protein ACI9OJ_005907 [Myxococcota bacterium]|jgi:hypothetical protein
MGGLRVVGAALLGFVAYALGLMGVVFLWFMRRDAPVQGVEHVFNVVLLLVLAAAASQVTVWVAGQRRKPALIGLAALVLGVGALNISLGQAIEPPWFTAVEMIVGGGFVLGRAFTKRPEGPAQESPA